MARAVVIVAVVSSMIALLPTSAAAAEKADVAFAIHLGDFSGAPSSHPTDQVVRTENAYNFGLLLGGGPLFCCQVGGELTWTLTLDGTRGAATFCDAALR